ncbi:endolytic transglycosylase MltG [Methyloversatilis thermotolerans]|uniref:endolytic transglycosylase MltG n=1 Tax=Methyloversatilis thermotolerans TaxID=1346290 RepID=UPI0003816B8E|nr:endolytic transglycosylase MltG [Methyloversatilis thermotolerans]
MIRLFVRLLVLALLCAALAIAALAWYATRPLHWTGDAIEYTLRPGTSLRQAALQIESAGVPVDGRLLGLIGRFAVDGTRLQAGSYAFEAGHTPLQLLEQMTRGDVSLREIRFIEGWTLRQMRAVLAAHPDVKQVVAGMDDRTLMTRLGSDAQWAEGWFFPDTYLFPAGDSDLDILKRAHHAMRRQLDAAWQKRAPDLPYASPEQALIMASIVEKETGIEADRATVASVFVNRLRAGMPLQTDPAVIYGLGERFDGNLTRAHLNTDGPFNTYMRRGLPPSAISAPGRASIEAALNPARTDYLYFVARGDGSSVFSRTLAEHNSAVDRYQRRPAKMARK